VKTRIGFVGALYKISLSGLAAIYIDSASELEVQRIRRNGSPFARNVRPGSAYYFIEI
jgi:hypothetical protein